MKFITHNNAAGGIAISGTCLQGEVDVSYRTLERIFGEPCEGDQYKTDANWYIKFEDGTIASIYNYKDGKNYNGAEGAPTNKIRDWHIGGNDKKAVENVIAAIQADGGAEDDDLIDRREREAEDAAERIRAAAPELLRSVKALSNWMREHTSPTQSDTPHDILVEAVELIRTIENGAWAVHYNTGEDISS